MERPPPLIWRRELVELEDHLEGEGSRGVLLVGPGGSGKTVLLRMLAKRLDQQRRAAFLVDLRDLSHPGELGVQILDAITSSPFGDLVGRRVLRSSVGAPPLSDAVQTLRDASIQMPSPVLLLDGLDESPNPVLIASAIEEMSLALRGWKIVVGSREVPEFGRFSDFAIVQLGALSDEDAARLLRAYPGITEQDISELVRFSGGLPHALGILGATAGRISPQVLFRGMLAEGRIGMPRAIVGRLVDEALKRSTTPVKLRELLERLALARDRVRIATVAARSGISEEEARDLLQGEGLDGLVGFHPGDTVAINDVAGRVILTLRLLTDRFRLMDLRFGAEEAERDELLDASFVRRHSVGSILGGGRSIVVGDRGAGKSAIFRKVAATAAGGATDQRLGVYAVTNTNDLLHQIVDTDGWLNADELRAAWLVVVAAVVASAVPRSAPKQMRREAAELRAAFGLSSPSVSRLWRALRAVARPFGGTTLRLAVGPVNLEAHLPQGGRRPGRASVDVESFLSEVNALLRGLGWRIMVLADRIDEIFKYDRVRQEAVVQALLQAEARVSQFDCVALVVFLRTDLFELYDIQEKNKLVSRKLTLDWSEEDWLQVLVRRVLANEPLRWAADFLRLPDGTIDPHAALRVLFPAVVEMQIVDRWLIDSLRNGNGDVSPRLAVLLLHLARDYSIRIEDEVADLPLFSREALTRAMTELSELSFSEVVNDFKVAPTFVLNCRAGKLHTFALSDIETLFDKAEGQISDQVRLLERLGFLERIVRETDAGTQSLFQIPKLYTRCWYAA